MTRFSYNWLLTFIFKTRKHFVSIDNMGMVQILWTRKSFSGYSEKPIEENFDMHDIFILFYFTLFSNCWNREFKCFTSWLLEDIFFLIMEIYRSCTSGISSSFYYPCPKMMTMCFFTNSRPSILNESAAKWSGPSCWLIDSVTSL